jgi:hypothetical protein
MTWRSSSSASRIVSLIIFAPLLAESHRYRVERQWSQPATTTLTTTTTLPFLVIRGGNNEESSGSSVDNNPVDKFCTAVPPTQTLADDSSPSPTIVEAVVDEVDTSSSSPDVGESNVSDLETIEGGVKSHIKSNAVGDPDGEGDSSDDENDDEDFLVTDWDESLDSNMEATPSSPLDDSSVVLERVQVEVEYTVEDEKDEAEDPEQPQATATKKRSSSGGLAGSAVRLGQRFGRHTKAGGSRNETKSLKVQASKMERHLLEAWQPFIFVPPPVEFETYLKERARSIDSDGRNRLDRRTLYGGLILEWSAVPAATPAPSVATTTTTPRSSRKFLPVDMSQSLQASLSLATQPVWRKSLQRPSAICLYDASTPEASLRGCTLAMQESVALALVRFFLVVGPLLKSVNDEECIVLKLFLIFVASF